MLPVLLSGGRHVHVDIADALRGHPRTLAARPLGPDPRLVEVPMSRTSPTLLQRSFTGPVTTGYGSTDPNSVPDAVTAARTAGAVEVVVAAYLLAPSRLHDDLAHAGADAVTAPLLSDDRIAAVLLDRYDTALEAARQDHPGSLRAAHR